MLPTLAVADLHGHLAHLEALLAWADDHLGPHRLVLLGDYCDNGPDVPGLLDRLDDLLQARPGEVTAVLGNHDLACLRALEDRAWFQRWSSHYWNVGGGTPQAYGARSFEAFRDAFPPRHRALLRALPWVHEADGHVFVHAGMAPGPLAPQVAELRARRLPAHPLHLPPPVRDKALSMVADPSWEATVVSAHDARLPRPVFVGPRRRCLRAEVDRSGHLHALVLPDGPLVTIWPDLHPTTRELS